MAGAWLLSGHHQHARHNGESSVGCGTCGHRRDAGRHAAASGCTDRGYACSVGRRSARIVVAVVAGAVTLELLRGDGDRSYAATIVVAGSCILALMALRWMFRQWLRAQRAQGRYRRGLVMIGTNEDAVAVWTMLHSQPELGYEVRGIIGKPRRRSDWATSTQQRCSRPSS